MEGQCCHVHQASCRNDQIRGAGNIVRYNLFGKKQACVDMTRARIILKRTLYLDAHADISRKCRYVHAVGQPNLRQLQFSYLMIPKVIWVQITYDFQLVQPCTRKIFVLPLLAWRWISVSPRAVATIATTTHDIEKLAEHAIGRGVGPCPSIDRRSGTATRPTGRAIGWGWVMLRLWHQLEPVIT